MKKILSILAVSILTAGVSFGACGKTVTDSGTLESYNAEKKEVTIKTTEGKSVTRTLTPSSKTTAKDGSAAQADALKGKTVAVISEHGKVQTISES